jgi:hypothetical protein
MTVTVLPTWTTSDALLLIRQIHEPIRDLGFAIGLAGSLVYRWYSDKDADLILYPYRKNEHPSIAPVFAWLLAHGWSRKLDRDAVRRQALYNAHLDEQNKGAGK